MRSSRTKLNPILLYASAFCVPACGSPEPDPCAGPPPPSDGMETVELGRALDGEFVPLDGSEEFLMETGPQGGQHIFVSIRFYALSERNWTHYLTLTSTATDEQLGETRAGSEACTPGWTRRDDVLVFVWSPKTASGRLTVFSTARNEQRTRIRTLQAERVIRIEPVE